MPLSSGTHLGPYEISVPLGLGGMGEVYRARDTRLDRTVAVKVLPSHMASDLDLRERFDREARTLSSLSHPNICHLYDVGTQDGVGYLVMEFLEGETLADRLRKGPLPLEQVLRYGSEICNGLERAHKCGVIHRDLKPSNVMLTKSGAKLMDFGLAKPTAALSPLNSAFSQTVTKSQDPLTTAGTVVGTYQYMSPEQLEGKEADPRSDIFALGAVLYEMATGQRAFNGKTTASVIGAILARDPPPISSIQPLSPPTFDRLVSTCLEKDPDERFQAAHDVKIQLEWISEPIVERESTLGKPRTRSKFWALSVIAVLACVAAFWTGGVWRNAPVQPLQFEINAPDKTFFNFRGLSGPPVVSPDGRKIAFVANSQVQAASRSLWLRSLDSSDARPIPGTEGATYPFWSPDGRFLAFFAAGKLKKFDMAGSNLITLCDVAEGRGGTWSTGGVIIFGNRADGLFRVDSQGGKPERLTTLDEHRQETSHRWPQFLPDEDRFFFVAQAPEIPSAHLFMASRRSPQSKMIMEEIPATAQITKDHLLYVQENNLLARPFDAGRLRFTGDPVELAEHVQSDAQFNNAAFSVSGDVLTYQTGAVVGGTWLIAFDRGGKETVLSKEPNFIQALALSPSGNQIAASLGITSGQLSDIWIYNLQKDSKIKLTFDQHTFNPIWSPDGTRIAFERIQPNGSELVVKSASGGGSEETLYKESQRSVPFAWSPDGRYLLYRVGNSASAEIKALSIVGERKSVSLLTTKVGWAGVALSSDGKWLAYASDESGTVEIYVVPFHSGPDGANTSGGKWQATNGGGAFPAWRRDGKELFFVATAGTTLSSIRVNAIGDRFEFDPPQYLFNLAAHPVTAFYTPATNGTKIYMATYGPGSSAPITVTLNWKTLLKK